MMNLAEEYRAVTRSLVMFSSNIAEGDLSLVTLQYNVLKEQLINIIDLVCYLMLYKTGVGNCLYRYMWYDLIKNFYEEHFEDITQRENCHIKHYLDKQDSYIKDIGI